MRSLLRLVQLVVIAANTLYVSALPAFAQVFVPGMPQGARTFVLSFFGAPVTCTGTAPTRAPTVFVLDYTISDVSLSYPASDLIVINPSAMMQMFNLDPNLSLFVIAHECGHVHLPTVIEPDADCFAATLGVQQGWFGPADFPALNAEFQNNPGNWSHPPGPVRVQHISDCMNGAANGAPLISTQ